MSRFIPPPQFLEEEKRNELGTVLIADPVVRIVVVELVQIDVVLTKVQRLCNGPHEQKIIERNRAIGTSVQESTFAYASLPLLDDLRSPGILLRVDFKAQNYFGIAARFSEIVLVDLDRYRTKSGFP